MQDIIKSVVLCQRILVVTCLAIFAFALSENKPIAVYKNALAEFREIAPSLRLVSNAINQKRDNYYFKSEFFSELEIKFNGLSIENTVFEYNDDQTLGSIYTIPLTNPDLDKFRNYFRQIGNTFPILLPDIEAFKEATAKLQIHESNVEAAVVYINIVDPFNDIRIKQPALQQIIPLMGAMVNIYIELKYENGSTYTSLLLENSVTTSHSVPFDDVKQQLYSNGILKIINDISISLPDLRLISRELEGIGIFNIEAALELGTIRESREITNNLELVGIIFNQALAYFVAPLVVISTLLYMLAHLRQAKKILSVKCSDFNKNAWIGLYNDIYSVSIFYLIIWALPMASIGLILHVANIEDDSKIILGRTIFFIFTMIALNISIVSDYLRKYDQNIA